MEGKVLDHYLEPIKPLLSDAGITEIMVNRFDEVFIERLGVFKKTDIKFSDDKAVSLLISQVASASGDTEASVNKDPVVNARLPDGSRFCGVLYPWSPKGSSFSIRKFPVTTMSMDDLIAYGSLTVEMADYLKSIITDRLNVLISGSTSSGKTTIVNALGSYVDPNERVVSVEDTEELRFDQIKNWLPFVAHNRAMDKGAQDVNLSFFITTALRMNPDRIFVGEIRESSAATAFIRAINTGHDGCVTTIHANGPEDAMYRLVGELLASGVPISYAEQQVWRNINIVIQAKKIPKVGRKITSISRVNGTDVVEVFRYNLITGVHEKC